MKVRYIWVLLAALAFLSMTAFADNITVLVGYRDGLRFGGFTPNPWQGGVAVFQGGGGTDDGAVMFQNNTSADITISNITVDGFANGASYSLWTTFTLHAGQEGILTATSGDNFDTSDQPISCQLSSATPNIHFSTDGGITSNTIVDAGQVLNTGGVDLALCGNGRFGPAGNESIGWHVAGDLNVDRNNQTPEPGSLVLLGSGLFGLAGAIRRKLLA